MCERLSTSPARFWRAVACRPKEWATIIAERGDAAFPESVNTPSTSRERIAPRFMFAPLPDRGTTRRVTALGIDGNGDKHPLGLVEGATENTAVVQALIDNLIERGLDPTVCRLFIHIAGLMDLAPLDRGVGAEGPADDFARLGAVDAYAYFITCRGYPSLCMRRSAGRCAKPGNSTTPKRPSGCCATSPAGSTRRRPAFVFFIVALELAKAGSAGVTVDDNSNLTQVWWGRRCWRGRRGSQFLPSMWAQATYGAPSACETSFGLRRAFRL
jgi:hypothetical protein